MEPSSWFILNYIGIGIAIAVGERSAIRDGLVEKPKRLLPYLIKVAVTWPIVMFDAFKGAFSKSDKE